MKTNNTKEKKESKNNNNSNSSSDTTTAAVSKKKLAGLLLLSPSTSSYVTGVSETYNSNLNSNNLIRSDTKLKLDLNIPWKEIPSMVSSSIVFNIYCIICIHFIWPYAQFYYMTFFLHFAF